MSGKQLSSSQYTFIREEIALKRMPTIPGKASCEKDKRFDVLTDREDSRINQATRNELAKICKTCPLLDCGWRQTYRAIGYRQKVEREIKAMEAAES